MMFGWPWSFQSDLFFQGNKKCWKRVTLWSPLKPSYTRSFLDHSVKFHHPSLELLLMVRSKSGINSPVELGSWNPIIYKVLYIQSGCFRFHPSTVGGAFPWFCWNFHPENRGKTMNQFLTYLSKAVGSTTNQWRTFTWCPALRHGYFSEAWEFFRWPQTHGWEICRGIFFSQPKLGCWLPDF